MVSNVKFNDFHKCSKNKGFGLWLISWLGVSVLLHFKVSIVQIEGALPISTHAQRYTWRNPSSRNQKPNELSTPLTPIREPDLVVSYPKPLKSYIAPTLFSIFNLALKPPRFLMTGAIPSLSQLQNYPAQQNQTYSGLSV